jgi:SAM-dependent methyltransferase
MSRLRLGRRKYYDLFSNFYDRFIRLHARQDEDDTRYFLVDAAQLPFADKSFEVVTCSHALYELRGQAREKALWEMKRVMQSDGVVLIMEHEVPSNPVIKLLFHLSLLFLGCHDGREFAEGDLQRLKMIFSRVALSHSQSGKSRLMVCKE